MFFSLWFQIIRNFFKVWMVLVCFYLVLLFNQHTLSSMVWLTLKNRPNKVTGTGGLAKVSSAKLLPAAKINTDKHARQHGYTVCCIRSVVSSFLQKTLFCQITKADSVCQIFFSSLCVCLLVGIGLFFNRRRVYARFHSFCRIFAWQFYFKFLVWYFCIKFSFFSYRKILARSISSWNCFGHSNIVKILIVLQGIWNDLHALAWQRKKTISRSEGKLILCFD